MWVLEARADAETVWYPVVWEETKDASNVIDYNINEEITIDTNSVFNANNDTTTGMSTLTYWVNAPRLLENTSIYQNSQEPTWSVTLTFSTILSADSPDDRIRSATIVNNYWNLQFKNRGWEVSTAGCVVPVSWWYKLVIQYAEWVWSMLTMDTRIKTAQWYRWDELIGSYLWAWYPAPVTMNKYFTAWTWIYVENLMHWTSNYVPTTTTIEMTLL